MPHWHDRFHYVPEQYQKLPFPFDELTPSKFTMETVWHLTEVLEFQQSCLRTANHEKQRGHSPIELICPQIIEACGAKVRERSLQWSLGIRVGRVR